MSQKTARSRLKSYNDLFLLLVVWFYPQPAMTNQKDSHEDPHKAILPSSTNNQPATAESHEESFDTLLKSSAFLIVQRRLDPRPIARETTHTNAFAKPLALIPLVFCCLPIPETPC